jgi:hypothetical protein
MPKFNNLQLTTVISVQGPKHKPDWFVAIAFIRAQTICALKEIF